MSSAIFLSIMIMFIHFSAISCSSQKLVGNTTNYGGCVPSEMKALLKFKESLIDPTMVLSSWNPSSTDCCTWRGIMCDRLTGHVIGLHLGYEEFFDEKLNYESSSLEGFSIKDEIKKKREVELKRLKGNMLDASLLELKHLTHLDMSGMDFNHSSIPPLLGSMEQLQYLNLSSARFSGIVPHHLGNLSNLRVLDLNGGYSLIVDDFMWVFHLSQLEHLDMSHVDLSSTKDLVKVLHMLPSLVVLILSECKIDNQNLQHSCVVNSSLLSNFQHLDLSWNSFDGELPCFLQNMTSLRYLDLSVNNYNSSSFHLLRLTNLVHLNLYWNSFGENVDSISKFIFLNNNCNLEFLDLSYNQFYGSIPTSLGRLSDLTELDLGFNKLSGYIPSSFGNLSFLRKFDLSGNNQLTGEIPISFGKLSNLEILGLTSTSLNGTVSEAHFAKMSKLKYLGMSSFRFRVGFGWIPPFLLIHLKMQSCDIGGPFPQWLQMQKELVELQLSNCSLSGTLPKWIHYINLTLLDLSSNHISGPIPSNISYMMPRLVVLRLNQNNLIGSIPVSLCEMSFLQSLDLSRNHLSGNFPNCNWEKFENKLSGAVPNAIGGADYSWLTELYLNNNNFTGKLPSTMRNCSWLKILDIGENKFSGELSLWLGSLNLVALRIRNNEFYGTIPSQICQLSSLQMIDLANNNLSGSIPRCIGNFSGMMESDQGYTYFYGERLNEVLKGVEQEYSTTATYLVNFDISNNNLVGEIPIGLTNLTRLIGVNFSHNHLEGKIPERLGAMKSLESLDLSCNNFSGSIPQSLSGLSSLSRLNLSYNNLSGQIPTGKQLQTLSAEYPSIYDGNPQLCGDPLPKKCHSHKAMEAPNTENHVVEEDEEWSNVDKVWLYGFIVSGFATGFWGVIGVLVFKISLRHAHFKFVERVGRLLAT